MVGSGDWVLVRKGKPVVRKATLEDAKKFYDMLRHGRGGTDTNAVIFGPGGVEWRCSRDPTAYWTEIFGERRSSSREREEAIDG